VLRPQLFIFIGLGIFVLILALVIFGPGRKPSPPPSAILEFWSPQDDEEIWREALEKFRAQHPQFTVNYRRLDQETYEETLVNRLAEGKGPDIFLLKNSWVRKHWDKIFPLPQDFFKFSARNFQGLFVDVAAEDLISAEGNILGLPLYIDTPALFYNKDIFNAAGIAEPPKTWEEFQEISRRLTILTPAKDIIRSGAAFGTGQNVSHLLEILSSLMFQRNEPIIEPRLNRLALGEEAVRALAFYTSFADERNSNFSWTSRLPASLDALAEEKTAMAVGFASDIARLRAKNPHLNLGIAPFPQEKNARVPVVYGSYFFPTVSRLSPNPGPAWQLVLFMTAGDGAKIYLDKAGRAPARRDLISQGAPKDELDVFYRQSLIARSWPIPDEKATSRLFEDMIESVASSNVTPAEAVNKLREQMRFFVP